MSKFEITKSVEAQKLNKRTGFPLSEPSTTIPYGAILDNIEEDGDMVKFVYLIDRYQIKKDLVRGALQPIGASALPSDELVPAAIRDAPAPDRPRLVFEPLDSRAPGNMISIFRARIPGGWIVSSNAGSVTFVPDSGHEWDGTSLKIEE